MPDKPGTNVKVGSESAKRRWKLWSGGGAIAAVALVVVTGVILFSSAPANNSKMGTLVNSSLRIHEVDRQITSLEDEMKKLEQALALNPDDNASRERSAVIKELLEQEKQKKSALEKTLESEIAAQAKSPEEAAKLIKEIEATVIPMATGTAVAEVQLGITPKPTPISPNETPVPSMPGFAQELGTATPGPVAANAPDGSSLDVLPGAKPSVTPSAATAAGTVDSPGALRPITLPGYITGMPLFTPTPELSNTPGLLRPITLPGRFTFKPLDTPTLESTPEPTDTTGLLRPITLPGRFTFKPLDTPTPTPTPYRKLYQTPIFKPLTTVPKL